MYFSNNVDSGEQVLCISFASDLDSRHSLFIINVGFKDFYKFHHWYFVLNVCLEQLNKL